MEKANTLGKTGATGVVVALESVSKMAADITDDRRRNGSHAIYDADKRFHCSLPLQNDREPLS
jgi:hypothetical protein